MTIRRRVLAGASVYGAMIFEFFTPGIAQIMQNAGCEYLIYDMEHTGVSLDSLKIQIAACNGLSVIPMVRVPRGEYQFLARALDAGFQGVMIPMVNSADEARAIVSSVKYPPVGRRGAAFDFAHDGFEVGQPVETMRQANETNLVIAQIETEHGLTNVDDIASVEGIDVLWVGHFDLTNFLGIPGDFTNPLYKDALKTIAAAAKKHGKGLGFLPSDATVARDYQALGFNMLAVGTDQALMTSAVRSILTDMNAQ